LKKSETLLGTYIDIASEDLNLLTDPTVAANKSQLLYDISAIDLSIPRIAFTGADIVKGSLKETGSHTVFSFTAAADTAVSTRILAPKGKTPVSVSALRNGEAAEVSMVWDEAASSLLLKNAGSPSPTEVTVEWQ
ncbi:MAG: hypothetical protein IJD14_04985, partial [Christensenellaceae bacterium]|nr:hypothetical protein [Christensenellaceae bacterium]